ncbi:MAG: hypothetical protein F9K37_02535 [Bacteroidales bacterium]|nr:MAG: hypothetical protein F9K37_02535 [Bacteroidales bacterium]
MSEKEKIEFKAGRELPFSVPDGYFDNLPAKIQARIQAETSASETVTENGGWVVTFRSQLAFAAGFAFMAVIAYFGYYLSRPVSQHNSRHVGTDYVEIVSRSISDFEDIDLYRSIENRKKQDTINEATREMYHRYYIRSNNCITIIDEKKEIQP